MIGHDRDASAWMPGPEKLDLFKRGIIVIAGMHNEKQRLVRLELVREQIIGT